MPWATCYDSLLKRDHSIVENKSLSIFDRIKQIVRSCSRMILFRKVGFAGDVVDVEGGRPQWKQMLPANCKSRFIFAKH